MKKLLIGLLLTSSFSFAQESPIELNLPKAVSYALENKAEAQKARLDIEQANAKIAEVRANALPNISANANTTFNPLLQQNLLPGEIFGMPGEDIAVALGRKWTSNANAQLTQTLFNQQVFTGLKAARSTKEFYQLNAQLTNEEIIEKVATAYYQVYQTQQMLENLQSNLELTEQTVNIVKGLFENGLAKEIDYDRSKVALNNLIASRQQALNAVELSENALKFMIGMSMSQEIRLPAEAFQPVVLPGKNLEMNERTELQLLNKQIELLNWQKKATLAEYYPSAALVANYGWLGQGDVVPLWNGKDKGVFWSDLSAVGLNIQIPIFNGGATKSRVKQNQIDIEKAQADFRETELALQLAYSNALAQLENNLITIRTQEENVELAQEVYQDTQNNYGLGLASLNDMLDAERDLAEAKNNLTNARLDYKLAEVELLKSQGKLETLNENNL
ncbi:TolC family protein [Antarcticibacterium sp. 1MA-6-2]|uniref:TolC family protein n=1 Tax=Antarcticibacterium sp. 1MA-6-2 TaxID=2908210 RepID=UPI001F204E27|nr:TolC family protein [Antarcticibacterium sp. 1MA-6-2]UJH92896.1 TolC family protein [Antarcticibacterium sp. 1MA-6-2]